MEPTSPTARLVFGTMWGSGTSTFLVILTFQVIGLENCSAARILFLPDSVMSHVRQHITVAAELERAGHEVHLVVSETFPMMQMFSGQRLNVIQHKVYKPDFYQLPMEVADGYFRRMLAERNVVTTWRENTPEITNMCLNPLSDEHLFQVLHDIHFDLAVIDIFPMSRCLAIIPYRLGVPYVSMTTCHEPWLMRNPSLPSYVPINIAPDVYTDKMGFWERFENLWRQVDWVAFPGVDFVDDNVMKPFFKDKQPVSLNRLAGQSLLWLMDLDLAIDYPRPRMPNEIYIGGLTTGPAQPLVSDIKEYLDSAVDGAILMTFGSSSYNMADRHLGEFLSAFRRIKIPILWKYIMVPKGLSSNVMVKDWLAQSDILGHPNIKLFITHCGSGGQFEALYHGVPTLGFPTFADQFYNCRRATVHGIGLCLDLTTFTADDLVSAVHEILTNTSFRENAKRRSELYKDQPMTARERIVYWIEHVLKYGGDHMHAHALDMPWYEYLMFDIFGFILLLTLGGLLFVMLCVWFIMKVLFGKESKEKMS